MSDEYLEMCNDFSNIISDEEIINCSSVLRILKKYASEISVFDMMEFSSYVTEENRYVQENYRKNSREAYIKSFLFRINDISKNNMDCSGNIDKKSFSEAIDILKTNYENEVKDSKSKIPLIFSMASIYSTFILKEPIHPVGTLFPGSLKVEEKNGKFSCPVKDANADTPNAVCNICLAEQADF